MSSPQPAQTTQVTQTQLPDWVNNAAQSNYQQATQVANTPLQQYGPNQVASTSPLTQQAYDYIGGNTGSSAPLFNAATNQYNTAANTVGSASPLYSQAADMLKQAGALPGQALQNFNAAGNTYQQAGDIYNKTAQPLDINSYLNPYTQNVQDKAINEANIALNQQLTNIGSNAQKAGAFGGSRAAVQSGVAQGEGVRNIGNLVATLQKQGFDTATANAIADRTGQQAAAAGLLGVGQGQTGVGTGVLNAANTLTGTSGALGNIASGVVNQGNQQAAIGAGLTGEAGAQQTAQINDANSLLTAGSGQQAQNQAQINALMQQFNEKRDYPIQQLNLQLAALGMSPYGKTDTTNKTSTAEIPPPDWATILLGGAKAAPGLIGALSDRTTKTDIKKLSEGKIPLYAFRYKGDPKTYPKMVGPMAQDVKKHYPEAVSKAGDKLTIDFDKLAKLLA